MKRIITAIGNEKLNHILKRQKDILIESSDIQYQEGIIEALDKYPETDIVVLYENIIGELDLEDLIRSIVIIKNDIEIILIVDHDVIIQNKEVVKIIKHNENYSEDILEYLSKEEDIKIEKVNLYEQENIKENVIIKKNCTPINLMSNMKQITKRISNKVKKNKKKKNVITVIGNTGSRKNCFYSYIVKNFKE